jgi:alpha-glucosidase (family GH31 glycosyl hydrolase)
MMGTEIMVAPILFQGDQVKLSTKLTVYFPGKGIWYDPKTGTSYQGGMTVNFDIAFSDPIPYYFN